MELNRMSGILAHPTSFPSKHGIGDLGEGTRDFLAFLMKAGQNLWQILPLNPTGYGDSPYQSFSTFACNDLLISPEGLVSDGLLLPEELTYFQNENGMYNETEVDYGPVYEHKHSLYRKAFARFGEACMEGAYNSFCRKNKNWLEDYALFLALKKYFIEERQNETDSPEYKEYRKNNRLIKDENQVKDYYYGGVWNSWPEDLAKANSKAIKTWRAKLREEIDYIKFLQFIFNKQWMEIKTLAASYNITIIGDMPIFVAFDSADLWLNQELFQMKGLNPEFVAGVPPDYFSDKGQLWGNPLYRWEEHVSSGFKWWKARLARALELVDVVRIDHFRGFEAYWRVAFGSKDAVKGKWVKAPGAELFEALGKSRVIAEDLGVITPEVTALRKSAGLPGMKILQFGMEGGSKDAYMPHNFDDHYTVVYTGTHDNDTTTGWYENASDKTKDYFRRYFNVSGENAAWDLIRLAFSSTADWALAAIQDVLSLGSEARMNVPGTTQGNWKFRFTKDMLTEDRSEGLKYMAKLFGRNGLDMEEKEEEILPEEELE